MDVILSFPFPKIYFRHLHGISKMKAYFITHHTDVKLLEQYQYLDNLIFSYNDPSLLKGITCIILDMRINLVKAVLTSKSPFGSPFAGSNLCSLKG